MGDVARLDACDGGVFSVDINGVLIRGHFIRIDRPRLVEIAWGELGNEAMQPAEAAKHAVGWPHFIGRLAVLVRWFT